MLKLSDNVKKEVPSVCIRDKQVNKHEVDIAELKTRIDYKHQRIDELKSSIDEMDKKLDKIDHCLSELKLQSERDDFNIDTRVTKIENTIHVLKWVLGIGLSVVTTAIGILTFILTFAH